jgi:hypothetical protein
LRELGERLSADQKQALEGAIKNVREKLNGNDADAIKQATDHLQNQFQNISAELYKQTASQGGGAQIGGGAAEPKAGGTTPGQSGENVVDADFEVVDDDKKKTKRRSVRLFPTVASGSIVSRMQKTEGTDRIQNSEPQTPNSEPKHALSGRVSRGGVDSKGGRSWIFSGCFSCWRRFSPSSHSGC